MKKVPGKQFLKGYGPGVKIIGGTIVATTVIVGGYFGYQALRPKTNSTLPTPSNQVITPAKASYNGTYTGGTNVAAGLANVSVTVAGTSLTGQATYVGTHYGVAVRLPATIKGTVTESGLVTATVNVAGDVYGRTITLTGPSNGQVTANIMNCSYTVSGDVGSYPGQISLTKNQGS